MGRFHNRIYLQIKHMFCKAVRRSIWIYILRLAGDRKSAPFAKYNPAETKRKVNRNKKKKRKKKEKN